MPKENLYSPLIRDNKHHQIASPLSAKQQLHHTNHQRHLPNNTKRQTIPSPRYNLGVAVVNDTLYAIGGYDGSNNPRNENERYTPAGYIPEFPSWTPVLLVLIVFAVAVAIYKRKLPRKLN